MFETYTTLDAALRQRDITQSLSNTDEYPKSVRLLTDYIYQASAHIQRMTQRRFVPYKATKLFDCVQNDSLLLFNDDLLEVTALADGNGTALDAYRLMPLNTLPAWGVRLTTGAWNVTNVDVATVTGWWGYHVSYANAWRGAGITLSGGINSTATSVAVSTSAGLEVLDYLKVNDEQMRVTAITVSGTPAVHTLTVERAVNGTTATTHDTGATLSVYQQTPDIKLAATKLAVHLYDRRLAVGDDRVQLADGATIIAQAPEMVNQVIRQYTRSTLPEVV